MFYILMFAFLSLFGGAGLSWAIIFLCLKVGWISSQAENSSYLFCAIFGLIGAGFGIFSGSRYSKLVESGTSVLSDYFVVFGLALSAIGVASFAAAIYVIVMIEKNGLR